MKRLHCKRNLRQSASWQHSWTSHITLSFFFNFTLSAGTVIRYDWLNVVNVVFIFPWKCFLFGNHKTFSLPSIPQGHHFYQVMPSYAMFSSSHACYCFELFLRFLSHNYSFTDTIFTRFLVLFTIITRQYHSYSFRNIILLPNSYTKLNY